MKLDFNNERHEYTLNGCVVPSVTQALAPLEMLEGIPPHLLEHARIRGQHVHEAMALLIRDALDWNSLDLELVPYIEGGKRFLDESGITIIASELRVACPKLKCAGTLDAVGYWRDAECVIDWKATATMPPTVGPQTSAYEKFYTGMYGGKARKRYCVQLKPGDYKVYPLTSPADYSVFISCLNVINFRSRHAA